MPISHSDLDAWQRRSRIYLMPFELTAMDKLEALFLSTHQPKAPKK